MLTDVGRPSPLWLAPFHGQQVLNCVREESQLRTGKRDSVAAEVMTDYKLGL